MPSGTQTNPLADTAYVADAYASATYQATLRPRDGAVLVVMLPSGVRVVADEVVVKAEMHRLAETMLRCWTTSFVVAGTSYRRIYGSDEWHTTRARFNGTSLNQLPRAVVDAFVEAAEAHGVAGLSGHVANTRRASHREFLDVPQVAPADG